MAPPLRLSLSLFLLVAAASRAPAQSFEVFETKVRPVLAERCFKCHGPKRQKGGLRLDSPAAIRRGGASGPAVVPGAPDRSPLVLAIRYTDPELQMPPKGRLDARVVSAIEAWVKAGAAMPADAAAPAADTGVEAFDLEKRKRHWAWQPLVDAEPPLGNPGSPSPIDAFLEEKLTQKGLAPAPEAEARVLVRRLYFDLLGLPPSPEEVEHFLADKEPAAWERLVDRLLASPHFGEKWARHWLDLVRYSETRGFEYDFVLPNTWHYRDYLIRAFNADVPYDRLLEEHVAGDLLETPRLHPEAGYDESPLGTAFWHFGEEPHSPVDPRVDQLERTANKIDVFSKAFLGMTVACARCHDHKFDAISTQDYYALTGFVHGASYRQMRFETEQQNLEVAASLEELRSASRATLVKATAAELRRGLDRLDVTKLPRFEVRADEVPRGATLVADWSTDDADTPWLPDGPGFGRRPARIGDLRLAEDPGRPVASVVTVSGAVRDPVWAVLRPASGTEGPPVGPRWPQAGLSLRTPGFTLASGRLHYLVKGAGRAYVCIDGHRVIHGPLHGKALHQWDAGDGGLRWVTHDLSRYAGRRVHVEFSTTGREALTLVKVIDSASDPKISVVGPALKPSRRLVQGAIDRFASRPLGEDVKSRRAALIVDWMLRHRDALAAESPAAIERRRAALAGIAERRRALLRSIRPLSAQVPVMRDGSGVDEVVLVRGNSKTPGGPAPRRFLEAIDGAEPLPIARGSGRRELARRMTDPQNPLVARVWVNRLWHHVFGRGLVASVDDFGVKGSAPSHPELLDWLARRLQTEGWSTKKLLRLLLTSRSYRMTSRRHDEANEAADPLNLLLHRMPLRRFRAEAVRDAILSVSGRLDRSLFGPPVPVHLTAFMQGRGRPKSGPLDGEGRRSIYLSVRRNFLSPFFQAFDFPLPSTCIGRRTRSNVPAQALALMNDPFVIEQAKVWARRLLAGKPKDDAAGIARLYLQAFAREPAAEETGKARRFLERARAHHGDDAVAAWADLAHALINTKEFWHLR